jgi:DNA-binding NarL/FixJ family response regulator
MSGLKKPDKNSLSEQEISILTLAAQGLENTQIAKILFISHHTVKAHMTSVFRKLGAVNRTEAVYIAIKNNLIS